MLSLLSAELTTDIKGIISAADLAYDPITDSASKTLTTLSGEISLDSRAEDQSPQDILQLPDIPGPLITSPNVSEHQDHNKDFCRIQC